MDFTLDYEFDPKKDTESILKLTASKLIEDFHLSIL